jgi:hypothetical protein
MAFKALAKTWSFEAKFPKRPIVFYFEPDRRNLVQPAGILHDLRLIDSVTLLVVLVNSPSVLALEIAFQVCGRPTNSTW